MEAVDCFVGKNTHPTKHPSAPTGMWPIGASRTLAGAFAECVGRRAGLAANGINSHGCLRTRAEQKRAH